MHACIHTYIHTYTHTQTHTHTHSLTHIHTLSHTHIKKLMGGAELQMSKIRAGVIRYKVYNHHDILVDEVHFPECGKMQNLRN